MPKQVTTKYTKFKDHKHSIRFTAVSSADESGKPVDPNPVRDIYVDRTFSQGMTKLEVTFKGESIIDSI
jgi:hypothetical protein